MAIIYSAIVPYTPTLIPSLRSENVEHKLATTRTAYTRIESDLYSLKPDTIIVVCAHDQLFKESFAVIQQDSIRADFSSFGDFKTTHVWKVDTGLISTLRGATETIVPISLIHTPAVHYSASIPLYLLTQKLPNTKVVIIGVSQLGFAEHVRLGHALHEILNDSSKRYACIISAELSSKQKKPLFRPRKATRAPLYDDAVLNAIRDQDLSQLLSLKDMIKEPFTERSYRQMLILYGLMGESIYTINTLGYHSPFDTGYITCSIIPRSNK